jgi:undecaprenyl-diphosphatase
MSANARLDETLTATSEHFAAFDGRMHSWTPPIRQMATLPMRAAEWLVPRLGRRRATALNLCIVLALLSSASWAIGRPGEDLIPVDVDAMDPVALRFAVEHREGWLTTAATSVTKLGGYRVLIPLVVIAGLSWWAWQRTWRPLSLLVGAYGGSVVLTFLAKALVGRSRPPSALALGDFGGMAFPSGHALQATAVWGMLAVLTAAGASRGRTKMLVRSAGAVVAVMVGASRVYLGAHWLTDVMGGWVLGATWLAALIVAARALERTQPPERSAEHS